MFQQDQEIFNILLETVSEGVVIVDNHQLIMETNTQTETMFRYNKKELVGRHINLLIPSNYHKDHAIYVKEFIKKGKRRKMSEATDIYALKKDGTIFPVEIELNPFHIYNKTYVMALIKDVSEKKEIKKTLMLRTQALQSANSGIVITDALRHDNPVIFYNDTFQQLTGYSDEEILNRNCRFLQGKDKDQKALECLRQSIKNGESCQARLRNYKKDGTMFWNDLYVFPITDSYGTVTNFIGILNDVTQRKIVEEERLLMANIIDESLNEIYIVDAMSLKIINANNGAQKNIGYPLEEIKEMTLFDLHVNKDEQEFKKNIDDLIKHNVQELKFESIHKRKNGSVYPVEMHLQIFNLNDKDIVTAIVLDITDRKNYTTKLENKVEERTLQLERALNKEKELNELKTKFLSMVSHEFKTPLSAILTSSELLGKYKLEEHQEKRDRHIKTIVDKVHFLNNIINDFLSVERMESGKVNYKFNDFKLSKVVNEAVYDANMLLKERQLIKYPENIDELSLYQDEKIIQLIISNLLYNAISYSPEGSTIELSIKQNNRTTTLEVKDNGIGIPKKDQKHIFERYFRAHNVINTQGTGIGLNIVKNHLENLGGTISFKSQENKGTSFTVQFPNSAKS